MRPAATTELSDSDRAPSNPELTFLLVVHTMICDMGVGLGECRPATDYRQQ